MERGRPADGERERLTTDCYLVRAACEVNPPTGMRSTGTLRMSRSGETSRRGRRRDTCESDGTNWGRWSCRERRRSTQSYDRAMRLPDPAAIR